tara:strand:- start:206 stop:490 length:285 start_codon:yes stop_codon:yes gene_type:complete
MQKKVYIKSFFSYFGYLFFLIFYFSSVKPVLNPKGNQMTYGIYILKIVDKKNDLEIIFNGGSVSKDFVGISNFSNKKNLQFIIAKVSIYILQCF